MPNLQDFMTPRGGGAIGQDKDFAAKLADQWRKEAEVRKQAQRLIDWYQRDRPKIEKHIRQQAAVTFGDRTREWQVPVINGVQRTIRRLAMTYKRPPERKYFIGTKELAPDSKEMVAIERMYRGLDLNKRLRQNERWEVLLNTQHIEVVYRRGRIDWDARRRPDVMVITDPEDYLHFVTFARRIDLPKTDAAPSSNKSGGFYCWSDEQYIFVRDDGWIYGVATPDGTNPFLNAKRESLERPIPIVTFRKTECDDYWGRYGADVVDGFEQACIQLGSTWEDAFMQGGVPIATNTGLGKQKGQTVAIGLKEPITVEGAIKDELPPNIEFKRPDSPIGVLQALIDWFVKLNSGSYGMPPSSWAQDEKVMSGFAKMIDSIELLEDRDENLVDKGTKEAMLFEASRMTWNRWHPVVAEHVNDEIVLEATFDEVEFPEAPADEAIAAATEVQNNFSSAVDWIMKKRKISNRAEALKMALQITEENALIQKKRLEVIGDVMGMAREEDGPPVKKADDEDANAS